MPTFIHKLILIILILALSSSFQTQLTSTPKKEHGADTCQIPRIQQFISNYTLPANDLAFFIDNNMSQFELPTMGKPLGTEFQNISASMIYAGEGRNITSSGDFKWDISNDGFKMIVKFNASVQRLGVKHRYSVVATANKVPFSYTKSYDIKTQAYIVTNSQLKIDESILVISSMTPENANDKQKISTLMKSDLIPAAVKNFDGINTELNSNAKKQHLSQLYDSTYNYRYYEQTIPIDMTTQEVEFGDMKSVVINGIFGSLIDAQNKYCPQQIQQPKANYTEFISLQFIRNFAEQAAFQSQKLKNVVMNKSNMRTIEFQFKLVDLEFLFDDAIFQAHANYYLNDVYFTCAYNQIQSIYMAKDDPLLHALISWNCKGFIDTIQPQNQKLEDTDILIADFETILDHQIQLKVSGGELSAVVDKLATIDMKFNDVGDFKIINANLAKMYLSEMLFQFRVYAIGTYFMVHKNSNNVMFQVDEKAGDGIWIG